MKRSEQRQIWQERVTAFRAAGDTNVAAWCRAHDLKEHQMRYWLGQFPDESAALESPSAWMPLLVGDGEAHSSAPQHTGFSPVKVYVGDVASKCSGDSTHSCSGRSWRR